MLNHLLRFGHLSDSEPLWFGQRQVFCYNSPFQCGFAIAQSEFQNGHQIQNCSKSDTKREKSGIRTLIVQFEMRKIRIILRNVKMVSIFSVSLLTFVVLGLFL